MKLKRIVTSALALTLGFTLASPALAAETADQRLTKVTQQVKATLGIGDEYTEFFGEPNETLLGTKWSLNWTGEDKSLSVSATEAGKVLSMNLGVATPDTREDKYGPAFPAMTQAQAKEKAKAFLSKVLTEGESAVFDDSWDSGERLGATQYGFGGTIYLNGLPTPMSFRAWVSVAQGDVTSFWRDDESQYVGGIPAPDSTTTADAARALLRDTLDFELIYVQDGAGDKAVLRYVPKSGDDYYVDARTGKLVDLTELRKGMLENASGGAAAADKAEEENGVRFESAVAAPELSTAELEGIAKLEGVLTKEELDAKVRAWSALKLSGFELSGVSYSVADKKALTAVENGEGPQENTVTARLSYNKLVDKSVSRRTVVVDAFTGELQSMSGYNPYDETDGKTSKAAAQQKGEDFLKTLWPEQFGKCALYTSTDAEERKASEAWVFTFAQKVNGYFFPSNTITVRVSADDGAIMGFSKGFDDTVTFDSADGLITLDAAKTAWVNLYPVELSYIAVPVRLDLMGADVRPLIHAGYTYYNALKPGYELGQTDTWYSGVDAKTGEPVQEKGYEPEKIAYTDIDGHWAQAALAELALYGVGWYEEKAQPNAPLTQIAYVALLCSADGYRYIPGESSADDLYDYAVRRGLLTKEQRQDDKALTRGEMVQMMLDSLGYGSVAGLKGIFRCDFTDAAEIPADFMGYAALAQGLGLVKGDAAGNFAAGRTSTRAEAATMLWQYMKR